MTPRTPLRRKREPVKVFPDGREVCNIGTAEGRRIYQGRIDDMWNRKHGLCRICCSPMGLFQATFDHEDGRGMNGSHRDDRIVKDGKPYNGAVHLKCNLEKGSRRGYVD